MRIGDVMTQQLFTCRESDSLATAARIMWDHDVGALPILGSDDRIAGIATDRDLCMAALFSGQPLWASPVGEHLRKSTYTVHPGDSLERALELMRGHKVRRLPVVDDDGHPLGIICMSDLMRVSQGEAWGAPDLLRVVCALTEIAEARTPSRDRPVPGARAGVTQMFTFHCSRCERLLEETVDPSEGDPATPTCPGCHRSDTVEKRLSFFTRHHEATTTTTTTA